MRKSTLLAGLLAGLLLVSPAGADVLDSMARRYLADTATPGGTMLLQGVEESLACLNPRFAIALASAIREARDNGIEASVYSACRPPSLRVGGFRDKHKSLHAYGLAVDMAGIGRPGSKTSREWFDIAQRHGLSNPYGWKHRAEWNHFQGTNTRMVSRGHPLRSLIDADGPDDLGKLWQQSFSLLVPALRFAVLPIIVADATLHTALSTATDALSSAVRVHPPLIEKKRTAKGKKWRKKTKHRQKRKSRRSRRT